MPQIGIPLCEVKRRSGGRVKGGELIVRDEDGALAVDDLDLGREGNPGRSEQQYNPAVHRVVEHGAIREPEPYESSPLGALTDHLPARREQVPAPLGGEVDPWRAPMRMASRPTSDGTHQPGPAGPLPGLDDTVATHAIAAVEDDVVQMAGGEHPSLSEPHGGRVHIA